MSSNEVPYIEQDKVTFKGPGDLPSYDDLAAHNGPNSRFGRWRGWIEKRARERYADLTPEELQRRRARGWDLESDDSSPRSPSFKPDVAPLHIQTSNLSLKSDETLAPSISIHSSQPLPFGAERLSPSHLRICQFGSRFLPHAISQIRCLLPLMGDRYLLIGHDEGLSVLDMFPQEWNDSGNAINKGPSEAIARQIWVGESVHQMSILETENTGEGTLSGIVLALVGPELGHSKDADAPRTLRMYNLASLVSLAKWAISSKGAHPLDLYKSNNANGPSHSPAKKHRSQSSIARSLKHFIEPQSPSRSYNPEPPGPPQRPSSPIVPPLALPGLPKTESSSDSQWELVDFENMPLRWANDCVPLASPGSRLINQNVFSYALWCDENRKGRGGQLLAVATKSNILLYETPKGERAFHFVKDFYTPFQPRSVTFFHQNVQASQELGNRHKRTDSMVSMSIRGGNGNNPRVSYVPSALQDYGNHLSLFVVFDKKAGWIRITDSAVGEMELFDDNTSASLSSQYGHPALPNHLSTGKDALMETLSSPTSTVRRIRHSMEVLHLSNKWGAPISKCDLALEPPSQILLVTRGKQTQVAPCPLPTNYSSTPPLWTVHWKSPPTHVLGRTCDFETDEDDDLLPFLQITAFGEGGIEVQEVPISLLVQGKGKGKGCVLEPSWAHEDLGGPVGFLCAGGHWDHFVDTWSATNVPSAMSRSYSNSSDVSTVGSEEMAAKLRKQEGVYGWWCKDSQDWRVFWIGGMSFADQESDNSSVEY